MINENASQCAGPQAQNSYISPPVFRRLRGCAFDPSLSARMETALVNETVFNVKWENLEPGPVGECVEVVDGRAPDTRFATL